MRSLKIQSTFHPPKIELLDTAKILDASHFSDQVAGQVEHLQLCQPLKPGYRTDPEVQSKNKTDKAHIKDSNFWLWGTCRNYSGQSCIYPYWRELTKEIVLANWATFQGMALGRVEWRNHQLANTFHNALSNYPADHTFCIIPHTTMLCQTIQLIPLAEEKVYTYCRASQEQRALGNQ